MKTSIQVGLGKTRSDQTILGQVYLSRILGLFSLTDCIQFFLKWFSHFSYTFLLCVAPKIFTILLITLL
jgi:hypothetical protein